jgi:hypothetical protein
MIKRQAFNIFSDFSMIESIKKHLRISDAEYNSVSKEDKKQFFRAKLEASPLDSSYKKQITDRINNIRLFEVDDIDTFVGGNKYNHTINKKRKYNHTIQKKRKCKHTIQKKRKCKHTIQKKRNTKPE